MIERRDAVNCVKVSDEFSDFKGPPALALKVISDAIMIAASCDGVTLLSFSDDDVMARRIHSTMPIAFPVFGTKPVPKGKWSTLIVNQQKSVLIAGAKEIEEIFDDHEHILAHDISAILNIPIASANKCIGSVNCLYIKRGTPGKIDQIANSITKIVCDADILA